MDEDILNQEYDIEDAVADLLKETKTDDQDDPSDEDSDKEEDSEGAEEAAEEDEGESEDPDESDEDDDEESDDEEDSEGDEDTDEEGEEEDEESSSLADDESEVVVTVDGQETRVSVGDLKRLAGQETALTQKAQAVAEQRRVLEAQGLYFSKALEQRYETAKKNAEKYANVDLYRASRELEPEEFDSLKEAKEAAEAEVNTLETEANEFLNTVQENRKTLLREQAKVARQVIQEAIPEWNDELYGKIRQYAVSQGMDAGDVNEVVDPGAIQMMHKAMKYDEAQKTAKEKVTKKVKKTSTKTQKKASKTVDSKSSKAKQALNKARSSGDIDDVVEAFMAAGED